MSTMINTEITSQGLAWKTWKMSYGPQTRKKKRHNEIMAAIDAEGGDASREIDDAKLAEKRG